MSLRYPGGLITKSPTAPTTSAAKGVWTLEQALQYIKAGTWPLSLLGDPYFQYNTLLLPGQGTNNTQNNSFLDSGTANGGVGFPINRSGETTQGTFSPFSGANGYWSNYFNGSGDYLTISSSTAFNFGTGNFTIQGWVYMLSYTTGPALFGTTNGATTGYYVNLGGDANSLRVTSNASGTWADNITVSAGNGVRLNEWTHIALVRNGSSLTLYKNGVSVASTSSASSWNFSSPNNAGYIGRVNNGLSTQELNGYISNLRVSNVAESISVPTSPLTAISGTVLLTCQNNRFVDNSSNAFAITVSGNTAVTPFQPFGAPTVAYSAATNGGSGYFDGTGDYLSSPIDAAFQFGTGDFTVESWWYPITISSTYQTIAGVWLTSQFGWILQVRSTDILMAVGGGAFTVVGSATIAANQWHHVAATRSGTTVRVFLNGVLLNSGTSSASATASTSLQIGRNEDGNQQYVNGYLSGTRLVKGGALYTATFTPPTSPPTTTVSSGTVSLLLNYTNAGVIDNAQDNDLITVADAKISTAQFKWGTSSISLDGTDDYLIMRNTENLTLGTGDFTIEFWVYYNSGLTADVALFDCRPASTNGVYPLIYSNTTGKIVWYINSAARITGTATLTTNTWYHVAVMRTGGSTKLFINGNQDGSTYADTNNYLLGTNRPVIGAAGATLGADRLNGYIQDLRVTKGYARYPYNFTAPTAAFPLYYQAAPTPTSDPYFDYTTLLLPGNQPSGVTDTSNNVFKDSSANNFTITRNPASGPNAPTQGTFTPFSQTGWGNFFDGSSVLFNTSTASSALNLSTGSFTIEAWVYLPSVASYQYVLQLANTAGNTSGLVFGINSSGQPYIGNGVVLGNSGSYALVANTWNHLAVVSNGTTIQFYTNGVANGSSQSFNPNAAQYFYVGRDASGSNALTGYISNLRVTKGAALYTSNFIPSTTPLTTTVSSGTVSLLTCQSNRFVDNSANTFAISTSGSPSVQAFSPFNPTAAYSAATVGGSGYFDGTSDQLVTPSNAALGMSTGDFTIELWYYQLSRGSGHTLLAPSTDNLNIYITTGGVLGYYNGATQDSSQTIPLNAWGHIAVVRSSGTLKIYYNGVQVLSQANSINYGTASWYIGTNPAGIGASFGYITDARIVKGTAVYTAAFTPPTAPLTAITNTSLLLNYTNGAIIDSTAKNDLETVGNAVISTAQSKFGGSSMFFDGTGDWLLYPATPSANFGTGDLTIEGWIYLNTTASNFYVYCSSIVNFSSPHFTFLYDATSGLRVYAHAGAQTVNQGSTSGWSTGTWYHVAFVRYGGTVTVYRNGISLATATGWSSVSLGNATSTQVVGGSVVDNVSSNGYMQDVRITRGIARYTQNFTPPTTAFLTL